MKREYHHRHHRHHRHEKEGSIKQRKQRKWESGVRERERGEIGFRWFPEEREREMVREVMMRKRERERTSSQGWMLRNKQVFYEISDRILTYGEFVKNSKNITGKSDENQPFFNKKIQKKSLKLEEYFLEIRLFFLPISIFFGLDDSFRISLSASNKD